MRVGFRCAPPLPPRAGPRIRAPGIPTAHMAPSIPWRPMAPIPVQVQQAAQGTLLAIDSLAPGWARAPPPLTAL